MKVYCAHADKTNKFASNYIQCNFCGSGWYANDIVPLVVIGDTDPYVASPNYAKQFEEKDLSKKQFVQCGMCKDLIEKRRHTWCEFRLWWKKLFKKVTAKFS